MLQKKSLYDPEPLNFTAEEQTDFYLSSTYHNCQKPFLLGETKERDHHLSGKYRGASLIFYNVNLKKFKYCTSNIS